MRLFVELCIIFGFLNNRWIYFAISIPTPMSDQWEEATIGIPQ